MGDSVHCIRASPVRAIDDGVVQPRHAALPLHVVVPGVAVAARLARDDTVIMTAMAARLRCKS
jgi:hypothetical protein